MKLLLLIGTVLTGPAATAAFAQDPPDHGPVEVTPAVRHDLLPSLRNVIPQPDGYARWHFRAEHVLPLPHVPPGQADGAVQSSAAPGAFAPALQTGVDGVGEGFSGPDGSFTVQYAPPDTVGAVGATQYVQIVNTGLAVFDKTDKSVIYGPVPTNTPWIGFGGACEADNDGDAVVVYDKAANRWIISQFAVASKPYYQCVAVSQTSDATGAYYRYAFSYGKAFPDYPKMGVWPDAYYETFNMFNGNRFTGSQLCAYDRASMLAGANATQQCFQLSSAFGGVLPADLDGSTPPPAGSPNYMINFGSNSLNLWKFHVDWANPANTTLSTPVNIPVAAFTPGCGGGACIPQSGTTQTLDSLADRLMFRLAYRNFGNHESLVVNHSVTVGSGSSSYTGVRWYELRSPGTTPQVFQQSTFSPDQSYRWMGSIAMDGQGNIALGYSVSSSTMFPAIRYTGRLTGDAANTMQAEASIIEGSGSQSGQNLDRWGDYSAMTVDPVDDCTFWYTNEYLQTTGAFNWSTRVASFKFDGCGANKLDQTITFTSTAPAGATFDSTPYDVTATATSGLIVTFTIDASASSVCSLSGSQVSFIGVGTCTINANQSGNSSYNPAPQKQQSFAVGKAGQTISFTSTPPVGASVGDPDYTVTATASSGLAVVLSIDPGSSTVCTIDGSSSGSHVALIGAGTCKINAGQSGNANYNPAPPAQQSFSVAPGTPKLVFTTQPGDIVAGDVLGTIAVTEEGPLGDTIDDNASIVDFTVTACGGPVSLGSAAMVHGVATLNTALRFYKATDPSTLQVAAAALALTANSDSFVVQANAGLVYADGFESCRP